MAFHMRYYHMWIVVWQILKYIRMKNVKKFGFDTTPINQ